MEPWTMVNECHLYFESKTFVSIQDIFFLLYHYWLGQVGIPTDIMV